MEIIKVNNLNFKYNLYDKIVLKDISFSIKKEDFVVVCGYSGSGKTTLLRHLKNNLKPYGETQGEIYYKGNLIKDIDKLTLVGEIGFVMQNPDNQIVTDTVWHELAFGLENLGLENKIITRRVAEVSNFFGINNWFDKKVHELSGGQKQLLNLASVIAMQPKVIILDEPTAQLDPISATEFLNTLKKVNQDLGITVIISEHRLENLLLYANKILFMDGGKLSEFESLDLFCKYIINSNNINYINSLPTALQISLKLGEKDKFPLTIKQGRIWLEDYVLKNKILNNKNNVNKQKEQIILNLKNIWYSYENQKHYVLNGLETQFYKNKIHCIVGGNGSGKTTLVNILSGIFKPLRGTIELNKVKLKKSMDFINSKILVLPQNPKMMFLFETVFDELKDSGKNLFEKDVLNKKIIEIMKLLKIENLQKVHPFDLSGGEQQKLALGKLLLLQPDIILLDEPTKGLDPESKYILKKILIDLKNQGKTIIIVSHDLEFCALNTDYCYMIFNGDVISMDLSKNFFLKNNFYTTQANKITRNILSNVVTVEDIIKICYEK